MLPGSAFRAIAVTCLLFAPPNSGSLGVSPTPGPQGSFYCPMHPDFRSSKQGKCPRCGMKLRSGIPPPETETGTAAGMDAEIKERSIEIPDVTVFDQDGKRLNFYSDLVKDRVVAINFIFTTCTTICPPLTATMSRVQEQLGGAAGRNIQLISITVDPTTDVPARLKRFAEKFGAKPGWTFVTGDKPEIDRLLIALGAGVSDPANHSPLFLIGNEPARYWTRSYGLASPSALRALIVQAAAKSAPRGPNALPSGQRYN